MASKTTRDEDTAISFVTYHFFALFAAYSLFCISTAVMLKWYKVQCILTRTNGLPFVVRKVPVAVVPVQKLTRTSSPAPEYPMDGDDIDVVEIEPYIALKVLSARYTSAKLLAIP